MSLHDTYFSEARYSVVALDVCMCSKAQAFFCIAVSLIATFAIAVAMSTADAPVSEQELLCQICQQPLKDGTPVEALLCTHAFHEYCMDQYALAKNKLLSLIHI